MWKLGAISSLSCAALMLLVHLATFLPAAGHPFFAADISPERYISFIWFWPFVFGLFVVGIPAVAIRRARSDDPASDSTERSTWVRRAIRLLFVYWLATFVYIVFYRLQGAVPAVVDGEFVLHAHGDIRRRLSAAEFQRYELLKLRLMSGILLLLYAMMAVTYHPNE